MDAVQNVIRNVHKRDVLAEECERRFMTFLGSFKEDDQLKYVNSAIRMCELEKCSLPVSFNDLMNFNDLLSKHVMLLFFKLYPYLCNATQKFVNEHVPNTNNLQKVYACHFVDFPNKSSLRELKMKSLGKLVKFRAQVIRSHPVHPELVSATFKCTDCGTIIKNVNQEFIYTQPTICANPQCTNRKTFELVTEASTFVDFQKVRVQETQGELPRGSVPRSMELILRKNVVEMAQPGDQSEFIGTLIVIPDISQMAVGGSKTIETKPIRQTEGYDSGVTGLKSLGVRDLTYKIAFLVSHVTPINNKYTDADDLKDGEELTYATLIKNMSHEHMDKIYSMSKDGNLVANLCNSLFATIHGSDEVKRGVLLMLFGGVPKVTEEGTKLRGDINVCIIGDPSTAKSQFLMRIEQFAHRAVYTSGKASSAAGLTAAVVKDQESYEYVIEAGALMLANNGICCIDEFDKMDVKDQVAIHEAMEQQTISITKAGVKATLNARTSVLAAANPVGGRYDRSKSLRQNISLSGPIMSRFDLFFVMVDECSEEVDYQIATKIVELHMPMSISGQSNQVYSDEDIRRYITFARCFEPSLTPEASEIMMHEYKRMRERDDSSGSQSAWRLTVRQLESLVRLSEAYARMAFSDLVTEEHVRAAVNLLNRSVIRVEQADVNLREEVLPTTGAGDDLAKSGAEDVHQVRMTYDEYYRISGALVAHMKEVQHCDIGMDEEERSVSHVRRNDLVHWYLESVVDTIDNEEDLFAKKMELEKIVQRLIDKDHVLMTVRTDLDNAMSEEDAANPLITLHPNIILE